MSTSGVLTDLTNAIVKSNVTQMQGIVTRPPSLLVSDGTNSTYACDVDVGLSQPYPNGHNQTYDDLTGVPGTPNYLVDQSLTIGTILRNVTIANNNQALLYAAVGNPVIVQRSASGEWQVTGFASQMPGTRMRYPVDLSTMSLGAPINTSVSGRLLTLGEIGIYDGGFGSCPFGASAVFRGGVLTEVVV